MRKFVALTTAALTAVSGMAVVQLVASPSASAATEVYTLPASGSVTLTGRGGGHGHGMSQFGAWGAANAGLTYDKILKFYYPGTGLETLPAKTIRVGLTSVGTAGPVVAAEAGLTLHYGSKTAVLASSGAIRYKLVKNGASVLKVQYRTSTAGYADVPTLLNVGSDAYFTTSRGVVRVYYNGGYGDYRGLIRGVITSAGVRTVNHVSLELYTQGVVPQEMPTSFPPQALAAQAVAARSYALYAIQHPASAYGGFYDTCDTQGCQVYGGMTNNTDGDQAGGEAARGNTAVTATKQKVVTYGTGRAAFTQFTGSNGGWSAAGDFPYLVAKKDPYTDAVASEDWWSPWGETPAAPTTVPVATIAARAGMARATTVVITQRDGHGLWGGRVLAGYVTGYDSAGRAKRVDYTGAGFRSAWGLAETYFTFVTARPSAPQAVRAACGDAGAWVTWGTPAVTGISAISSYVLSWPGGSRRVSAATRKVWVGPLTNGTAFPFSVRAVNGSGYGAVAAATCAPKANPGGVKVLTPSIVFDSRPGKRITASHPLIFTASARRGGYPTGARAVQVSVSIVSPSASGQLRVYTSGNTVPTDAVIHYRRGRSETVLVTIPLTPTAKLVFRPTAGAVDIVGTRVGYQSVKGGSLTVRTPKVVKTLRSIPRAGTAVSFRRQPGVTSATKAVLVGVTVVSHGGSGTVHLLPNGVKDRASFTVHVQAGTTQNNVALMPLSTARYLRVYSSSSRLTVQLSLLGTVGALTSAGRIESVPVTTMYGPGSGRAAITVTNRTKQVRITGMAQVPATGVRAVLVVLTTTKGAKAGNVRVRPTGSTAARGRVIAVARDRITVATALLPVGRSGSVNVVTDGPSTTMQVRVIGYVTS